MNFAFPWPYSHGEWFAWGAAIVTILLGTAFMLFPRSSLRGAGVRVGRDEAAALGLIRSLFGGFAAGIGLSAVLLAQPLLYAALGFGWALAALGRIISILVDGDNHRPGWIGLVMAVLLAFFPLAFAFGLLA